MRYPVPRLRWLACGLAVALVSSGAAFSQGSAALWPARPVTMVIPFLAGGPTDTDTRLYAQKLRDAFGQPFFTDNRPGAGGTIGAAFVAKAAPDGYTLMMATAAFTVAPALYKSLPYDPIADFAPVALITKRAALMVVNPALPVKSVAEYIAYARANPGKLNFGTPGLGSGPHLAGELFHNLTNTRATYVHYKGTPQMALDMVSGRLDASINIPAGSLAHVKSGKLRLLGTTGIERTRLLPDVPSIAEQGVVGFDYGSGLGILAPRGTPAAIVSKLSAEIARHSKNPEIFQKLAEDGNDLLSSTTPEQYRQYLVDDVNRWRKVVQASGIKLEE